MKKVFANYQFFSFVDFLSKVCYSFLIRRARVLHDLRGGKFACYANDTIGNAINAFGFYELNELNAVFSFMSPLRDVFGGGIALDIGANIGNHSVYFSRYFKQVLAFEPHPVTSKILSINAELYSKIKVFNYGLSDIDGIVEFEENSINLGGSRIAVGGGLKIRVRRLDDLDLDPKNIVLMKLDVEGHEASVLRGGHELLNEAQPVILFEAFEHEFSTSMDKVEILKKMGYKFAWLEPLGTGVSKYLMLLVMLFWGKIRFDFYSGDRIAPGDHSMIIAVPPRWQFVLKV